MVISQNPDHFSNNINQAYLTSDITASQTSISVSSSDTYPEHCPFRIRIEDEIMLVVAGAKTTSWTVIRGVEQTSSVAHPNSALVTHIVTAETVQRLNRAPVFNVCDFGARADNDHPDPRENDEAFFYAIEAAHAVAGIVYVPPSQEPYLISRTIKLYGSMTLQGGGMQQTTLKFADELDCATGPMIRELQECEPSLYGGNLYNPQGAKGLWIRDMRIEGNSARGDGIRVGEQVPDNQLNFGSGLENLLVMGFQFGTGIWVNQNAAACSYLWSIHNNTGIHLHGEGGSYYGLWAEGNILGIGITGSGNSIFHIHCEHPGPDTVPSAPVEFLRIEGHYNRLFGVDFSINRRVPNLIEIRQGSIGNSLWHLYVRKHHETPNAGFNHLIHDQTHGCTTGPIYNLPFFIDGQGNPGLIRTNGNYFPVPSE